MQFDPENQEIVLDPGDDAPDFSASAQYPDGSIQDLNLYSLCESGKKVLLIFYPKDNTPGCTKQMCGVRDIYQDYKSLGVEVFGVNNGSSNSHKKFIDNHNFPFGIIIDEENKIRNQYGAVKHIFGNLGTKRGVFLIDTNKKILFIHWGQQDNQKIISLLESKKI